MKQNEERLLEWIQQNRKKVAEEVSVSADKLPYYGKYCGSFAGQVNISFSSIHNKIRKFA